MGSLDANWPRQTFNDALLDLLSEVADGELLAVKLQERMSDREFLTVRQDLLSKALSEIDDILEHHRKCRPGHAVMTVSIRRPSAAAATNTQNAVARMVSAGNAAYRRSQFVTAQQVHAWFSAATPKGNLTLALQGRIGDLLSIALELGAGAAAWCPT
jgi:hypothetical protein